jgi:hypothetical protein
LLALDTDAVPGRAGPLLDALERWPGEQDSPQLAICRALVARQQEDFNTALQALLTEHERRQDAKARAMGGKDEHSETERYVFVEGLALLRLAQRRGLTVQPDSPFLPSLARAF